MSTPDPAPDQVADKIVAVLDRIARGVRTHRQATASSVGLTPLQLELLRTVAEAPPPRPAPGRLAVELGVSQPTVTDSLLALERKGHVRRREDPDDRRRTEIALTPSGERLVAEAGRADEVLRDTFTALPAADRERLLGALLGTIGGLLDAGIVQVARTCTSCRYFRPAAEAPAHCTLLQTDLAPAELRVNCVEHLPAAAG